MMLLLAQERRRVGWASPNPTVGAKLTGGKDDLRIRVSGLRAHNGCAQPESGDNGIYGEADVWQTCSPLSDVF